MRKYLLVLFIVALLMLSSFEAFAEKPPNFGQDGANISLKSNGQICTSIQSGELSASDGSLITTGYDHWGYNYQAHMFNGGYCDAYRDDAWCQDYKEDVLIMKWNDAWLSNVDCDNDGLLDRHFDYPSYIGSSAWLTNHARGDYEQDSQVCKWETFVKIIAAPANATLTNGMWFAADGTEIGPVIWSQFAIIQQVENDPCGGNAGLSYLSPDHAGFGGW